MNLPLKKDEDFFQQLEHHTIGGNKTTRFVRELRDHLEDAKEAGIEDPVSQLGNPKENAALYNRIRLERDGFLLVWQGILLGCFSLIVQLIIIWLLSGLGAASGRFTELPMFFAVNPDSFLDILFYASAFLWVFIAFWVIVAKARHYVGNTRLKYPLIGFLYFGPILPHLLAYFRLQNEYHVFFPWDFLAISFVVLSVLIHSSMFGVPIIARMQSVKWKRWNTLFWIIAILYIGFTTFLFSLKGIPSGIPGESASNLLLAFLGIFLATPRFLFEMAVLSMTEIILGFLTPPWRWVMMGYLFMMWSTIGFIGLVRWCQKRKERVFPWAGLLVFVYTTCVFVFGPTDYPDLYFSRAFDEVSHRIEYQQMSFGTSLNRYFHRQRSSFPDYHIRVDPENGSFLIAQSEIHPLTDATTFVGQWRLTPGKQVDDYQLESMGQTMMLPKITFDNNDYDTTLEALSKDFTCETDEPFPSCFRLLYQGQEIFSQDSRSVVVADTEISPDGRWLLLLLSMRYSGNEYLYLVDLQNNTISN